MESGVTIPGEHVWRNTAAQARYYTFDSERYQMIEDFQGLRDIAAHVPYDHIYVLSNTQKYGGGGIYNFMVSVQLTILTVPVKSMYTNSDMCCWD